MSKGSDKNPLGKAEPQNPSGARDTRQTSSDKVGANLKGDVKR